MEQRAKEIACSKCQGEMQQNFAPIFPWLDDTGMKRTQQAGRRRALNPKTRRVVDPYRWSSCGHHERYSWRKFAVVAPPLRIGRLQCCESRDGD